MPRSLAWARASQRNPSQSALWLTTVFCIYMSTEKWSLAEVSIKMQGFFSVIEQDVQLEVAKVGGIACVSQQI